MLRNFSLLAPTLLRSRDQEGAFAQGDLPEDNVVEEEVPREEGGGGSDTGGDTESTEGFPEELEEEFGDDGPEV